jgi:NAD(P)H-dependent flavin oxidoreductase YrpB (nitropropane dioxygenase family)
MLSGTWREPEALRALIRRTRARTHRPFGVNLVLAWDMTHRLEICLDEGVTLLSFFWGTPPEGFVGRCHRAGARVFHSVGDADEARIALDCGVDFLVAQGVEAGGHVRGVTPLTRLLPEVIALAGENPVLAAGGIGDAAGVRAALDLGAQAAWCGTRFLLAEEAAVHPRYRERLIAASAAETHLTTCFSGGWPDAPHRVLENETLRAWEAAGRPLEGSRPGEGDVIATDADGSVELRYTSNLPRPGLSGQVDELCLYAGESVAHARAVQPAAVIAAALGRDFL